MLSNHVAKFKLNDFSVVKLVILVTNVICLSKDLSNEKILSIKMSPEIRLDVQY